MKEHREPVNVDSIPADKAPEKGRFALVGEWIWDSP
jgi:hypothetical protein